MTTMLPILGLATCLVAAVLALCSAHIPGLRRLTGAAPLESEDEGTALSRDFAASKAAGYVTRPDWGTAPIYPKRLAAETKEDIA